MTKLTEFNTDHNCFLGSLFSDRDKDREMRLLVVFLDWNLIFEGAEFVVGLCSIFACI